MAAQADPLTLGIGSAVVLLLVFALIRLVNRYGGVEHGWLMITDEETAMLEAHHARTAPTGRPPQRSGRPIYKWSMGAHEGLTIYQNGLFAKFSLGRKGENSFVPWELLSGIYPVHCRIPGPLGQVKAPAPPKGRPTMWTGRFRPEWQELQVETADGRVFAVDSRYHDLDEVSGVLKERLGERWAELFQPEPHLTSTILSGDLYLHRLVRDERARGGPKGKMLPLHWDADHL